MSRGSFCALPRWLGLSLVTLLCSLLVSASPSVNVALQASFDAGPYLLELLETAAEENATSYFPILDRVADGYFADVTTEKELYEHFLQLVQDDGHFKDADGLSSFQFALSIRSAAPRIQAHYQYYNTSVESTLMVAQDAACPVWIHYEGKQYCSPTLERAQQGVSDERDVRELPFDRITGDATDNPCILYADITSPLFGEFHRAGMQLAREGFASYRVRYRSSGPAASRPLFVNGYGVELSLKRTDYIVIDDRDAENVDSKGRKDDKKNKINAGELKEETPADLKPLSASELLNLGLNAASFVMNSDDPFETLVKLSQDFPKHSSAVAAHNATPEFLDEFKSNRATWLPAGYNMMWINGAQIDGRNVDAFSILEHLRRERKLIDRLRDLGLTAQEGVKLLSNKAITVSQMEDEPQRYDYRDTTEGGNVIIWLNNMEKDQRYEGWPSTLQSLLQPGYPGQLPAIRRDIQNVIFPVDLADPNDIQIVAQHLQMFVKRKIPARFGIVPTTNTPTSVEQAKMVHHLLDTYGLGGLLSYLEDSLSQKKFSVPSRSSFETTVKDRNVRADQTARTFDEVLQSDEYEDVISATSSYLQRLAIESTSPVVLVNGVVITRGDNWTQLVPSQISRDLQTIQRGIMEGIFDEDSWLPEFFLFLAAKRRNTVIVPTNADDIRILDLGNVYDKHASIYDDLPRIAVEKDSAPQDWAHVILAADFNHADSHQLLANVLTLRKSNPAVEILLLHNPENHGPSATLSSRVYQLRQDNRELDLDQLLSDTQSHDASQWDLSEEVVKQASNYWAAAQVLLKTLGIVPGQSGLVWNGRLVTPVTSSTVGPEDLELLLNYERIKRLLPAAEALQDIGLLSKVQDPLSFAKISSMIALSAKSDVPEGIFESTSTRRIDKFDDWNSAYTGISLSTSEDPTINIVAAIDPTSEIAQRWLSILKVLSKLNGVSLKIFLNPRERLQELPVKRFYRYVLEAAPSFDEDGSIVRPEASFTGVPDQALLNLGMDVPPSWLVAPKDSVHDLDNIKLGSLKDGTNVEAVYELEHILIEGHSRDTTSGSPPRGVQLLLGTQEDPHFVDTIIMANLGYFQFKAQPGIWQIRLKPGRSERIFNIDSVGGMGYNPQPGDENNEVALLSFQGTTLFPRLSRKPGQEEEDVLEVAAKPGSAMDYVSKGLNFAQGVLSSVGVKTTSGEQHADINIFSVASGHLYERMLNIMMVSVMRHTKHTVKFWFIEQFLSPSFKSFLPHLAEEYGFSYEMVTYKWPHWLRAQREKQREIWGYKILFLDVLFPLSLDKVIFVDADQIVRTDMYELTQLDLEGAPYGFTPMGDSRTEMEGFRFWKQGYWANFLRNRPYHISALYVVDLNRFRQIAAGDRLRGQYHTLSADPNSLSNLDQDLPNHMQHVLPIKSLPQEWLWCETWCADEDLAAAKTIDLCNNPQTKEPKLDRARRQVPEWTEYDDEIAALARRVREREAAGETDTEQGRDSDAEPEREKWNKEEL